MQRGWQHAARSGAWRWRRHRAAAMAAAAGGMRRHQNKQWRGGARGGSAGSGGIVAWRGKNKRGGEDIIGGASAGSLGGSAAWHRSMRPRNKTAYMAA